MRARIRLSLLTALALSAASCAPMTSTQAPEPEGATYVVVENESTQQVTVYVLRDAQRQRLGTASALVETRLRIPDNMIFGPTPLRFEIHPLGSRATPISTQITVSPGEQIRLRVPSTIR